jgi:hypothetical protein
MKFKGLASVSALVLCCALVTSALATNKGFLWNGNQWKDMNREIKVAYVKGIGNMADFETGAARGNPPPCISKAFVDELKTKTISQVIAEVDKYYKENPKKLDMPVIAVILQRCTKICGPAASAATAKK